MVKLMKLGQSNFIKQAKRDKMKITPADMGNWRVSKRIKTENGPLVRGKKSFLYHYDVDALRKLYALSKLRKKTIKKTAKKKAVKKTTSKPGKKPSKKPRKAQKQSIDWNVAAIVLSEAEEFTMEPNEYMRLLERAAEKGIV